MRKLFGGMLGANLPTSGVYSLGQMGPLQTASLNRPQLRWGGLVGRSALEPDGSLPVTTTLNSTSNSGVNSFFSSGTTATAGGGGDHGSGNSNFTPSARWSTHNLGTDGSFTYTEPVSVTIEVWGAAGGSGNNEGYGGGGEYRKATFDLAPGTYYYLAGHGGGAGDNLENKSGSGGHGGGGCGGSAGSYPASSATGYTAGTAFSDGASNIETNNSSVIGAGGGGCSGIFTSSTFSQAAALIVAGGGGGAGRGGATASQRGRPGGGNETSRCASATSGGTGYKVNNIGAEDGSAGLGGSGYSAGGGGGGGYWGGAGGYYSANYAGGGGFGFTHSSGTNTTIEAGLRNRPGGRTTTNYTTAQSRPHDFRDDDTYYTQNPGSFYGQCRSDNRTSGGGGLVAIAAEVITYNFTSTGVLSMSEIYQQQLG